MHGKFVVQIGDGSLSEGTNMKVHKNAKRFEKFCNSYFQQVGRINI